MSVRDGVFTPSPTPPAHPRIRPEASEYARKNKTGSEDWYHHNNKYEQPRAQERIVSNEARNNFEKNKGHMDTIFTYGNGSSHIENGTNDIPVHVRNGGNSEAEQNAMRGRGRIDQYFDQENNRNYSSPRPQGRAVTGDSEKFAEINKGCMSEFMQGYADPPVERKVHPRGVKGEAAETAQNNKGGAMRNLIENYGTMNVNDQPQPKVKGYEAEENAERNKGSLNKLLNTYVLTPGTPPAPKVYYEGQAIQEKYQGKGMGPMMRQEGERSVREPKISKLHQRSEGPGWDEDPPAVRMRPEAEQIAAKYTETQLDKVVRGEVAPPTVRDTKVPRHLKEAETPRPQTSPLRTRPEAMANYQKHRSSEMGSILRMESTSVNTPRKYNRNMRSEDW
ncbi:Hypothetical predicted protein [Mytilus galloprovincialis]|uniref:Uncharacterized protein n=1 Tax=Mytilus galloprovincialis TaxID=29158 RepID=A0A8B6CHD2_MYTGA|nr:Hypothetical predicted protein [Mytilus galloprovincialis]